MSMRISKNIFQIMVCPRAGDDETRDCVPDEVSCGITVRRRREADQEISHLEATKVETNGVR